MQQRIDAREFAEHVADYQIDAWDIAAVNAAIAGLVGTRPQQRREQTMDEQIAIAQQFVSRGGGTLTDNRMQ